MVKVLMAKVAVMVWLAADIVEGVAGHRTHRDAVHQHISHMVAGARGDGEGLVSTVVHRDCSGWADRAIGACRCCDGVRC